MRLIDADYLKEKGHYDDYDVFVVDYDDIKNAPTVDPVKHGHWEIYDAYKQTIDGRTFDGWCECSECRTMYPWGFSTYNYCPNCGARMVGEENEID